MTRPARIHISNEDADPTRPGAVEWVAPRSPKPRGAARVGMISVSPAPLSTPSFGNARATEECRRLSASRHQFRVHRHLAPGRLAGNGVWATVFQFPLPSPTSRRFSRFCPPGAASRRCREMNNSDSRRWFSISLPRGRQIPQQGPPSWPLRAGVVVLGT
jgi:hypothetical protein